MEDTFLSTLSLRRATALRFVALYFCIDFYPRSPCGERPYTRTQSQSLSAFLSTLSLRRATISYQYVSSDFWDFYPRSPCGERLNDAINGCNPDFISIHALLAESDVWGDSMLMRWYTFLSTLSLRRATTYANGVAEAVDISIHALLAESDPAPPLYKRHELDFYPRSPCGERLGLCLKISVGRDFYPRSPCGERLCLCRLSLISARFLSTLSLRRATIR